MLFPGTGFAHDLGGPDAEGSAVNVALPPGTGDAGWLRAFHAVVPPLVREFAPDVLVTQHGCDSHMSDPLAHLMLSVDGQRAAYQALHDLAHEVTGGKWVVTGGGGYAIVDVVPRAWTHLLGVVSGRPVDPEAETPEDWRGHVAEVLHQDAPTRMTDGRDSRFPGLERGLQPGDVARQVDPGHAGGRFPPEWPRSHPVMSRIGPIGGAGETFLRSAVVSGLRLSFHTSHTRPYPHLSVARGISGGEAGDVPGKVVRT